MNQIANLGLVQSPITTSASLNHFLPMLNSLSRLEVSINSALLHTNGTHEFEDVVHMVMNGRLSLIALPNSFLLLEVLVYPRTRHLNVFLSGGVLKEIATAHSILVQKAKDDLCSEIHMCGRAGWTKVMKPYGWTDGHSTMKYEVHPDG